MSRRVTDRDSIEIFQFDDWCVLQINGITVDQAHRIGPDRLLENLGISHSYTFVDESDWPLLEDLFLEGDVENIIKTVKGAR
jgi:hypothetical protein